MPSVSCPALTRGEILTEMGYKDSLPDGAVLSLIDSLLNDVCSLARPSYYYRIVDCALPNERQVVIGHEQTLDTGTTISHLLQHSQSLAVFAATVGCEVHRLIENTKQQDDILRSYVLDVIGTCLVEKVGDRLEQALEAEISPLPHTYRLSPGYCNWPLTEQKKLFALMGGRPCDIELSEVCLMTPVKSISGVIGIGPDVLQKQYACNYCELSTCYKRKRLGEKVLI